jgi:phosphate transport system permease protein
VGLLLLIMFNGLGYFWPADIIELTLSDGTHVLGQWAGREVIPPSSAADSTPRTRIRLKIGNRDLYGLDFKWVDEDTITSRALPGDAVLLERREWGNMYGRIQAVYRGDEQIAQGDQPSWEAILPLITETNALHARISRIERVDIGAINTEIDRLRLKMRRLELHAAGTKVTDDIERLKSLMAAAEARYQEQMKRLESLNTSLNEYTAIIVDANGKEKQLPVSQIIRALRPNAMGWVAKSGTYMANVWRVLTEEPREANTEGGIFPAIFGTVMMVFIMTIAVVPFGVLAALYLREYARQGVWVRLVRIAVNNLAGVPSIVFGVFGLGFFVYAIGGTIDKVFFP